MCILVDSSDYVWEIHRYKNDMKWGAWKYFNGNHQMVQQILYRKGKRIWTYEYRDGEVIKSINKKGKVRKFKGCGC